MPNLVNTTKDTLISFFYLEQKGSTSYRKISVGLIYETALSSRFCNQIDGW